VVRTSGKISGKSAVGIDAAQLAVPVSRWSSAAIAESMNRA
jgi:hypothetical protein